MPPPTPCSPISLTRERSGESKNSLSRVTACVAICLAMPFMAAGLGLTKSAAGATHAVARRVAHPRETIFGGYWDFTANMEHKDTAYTTMAIGPHTDGTYSFDAPGYQMFHCLAFDGEGGASVFVDGFEVADI